MNNRIKFLRTNLGMNQSDFAQKLSISRSAICKIESGENSPSEQTISLICREFNVNEEWLRNGTGNMFKDVTRSERITQIINALDNGDEFILDVFTTLSKLSLDEWEFLKRILLKLR